MAGDQSVDRLIPIADGGDDSLATCGSDSLANLRPACARWNRGRRQEAVCVMTPAGAELERVVAPQRSDQTEDRRPGLLRVPRARLEIYR